MTEPTPNGVPCRHCGLPIAWDEVCWVHDNGWAACGFEFQSGEVITGPFPPGEEARTFVTNYAEARGLLVTWDPDIVTDGRRTTLAEPEGEWS